LGIFGPNFTYLLRVPIYARQHIFIQLPPSLTKLCHIKRDHLPSVEMHAWWLHLLWHNFVTVGVNWIKMCSLV